MTTDNQTIKTEYPISKTGCTLVCDSLKKKELTEDQKESIEKWFTDTSEILGRECLKEFEKKMNIVPLPYSPPDTKYLELVDAYERGIEKAFGLPKELMNGPREYARRMQSALEAEC